MKKCAADKNIPRYGRHDMAFHQAIAGASGNRFFIWFLATANKALFRELWKRPLPIDVNRSLRGHERILRTIEARDRAAAQEEMLNHLSYRSYFAEQDSTADLRFVAERSLGKIRSRAGGRAELSPSAGQIQARWRNGAGREGFGWQTSSSGIRFSARLFPGRLPLRKNRPEDSAGADGGRLSPGDSKFLNEPLSPRLYQLVCRSPGAASRTSNTLSEAKGQRGYGNCHPRAGPFID